MKDIEYLDILYRAASVAADSCAICLEPTDIDNDCVVVCDGKHRFHADCIKTWLPRSDKCPVCRRQIDKPMREFVKQYCVYLKDPSRDRMNTWIPSDAKIKMLVEWIIISFENNHGPKGIHEPHFAEACIKRAVERDEKYEKDGLLTTYKPTAVLVCAMARPLRTETSGHVKAMHVLIETGSPINAMPVLTNARTPLMVCAALGRHRCIRLLLLAGADTDIYPETMTIRVGKKETKTNFEGVSCGTALHVAATHGNTACIHTLIGHGMDVDITLLDAGSRHADEITPLMKACGRGGGELDRNEPARYEPSPDAVKALLSWGADVTLEDTDGCTALHYAATNDNEPCMRVLIEHGVNVNAFDIENSTPLMNAVMYTESSSMVALLLKNSADVNAANDFGSTALTLAMFSKDSKSTVEIVRHLVRAGADVNVKTNYGKTPLLMAMDEGRLVDPLEHRLDLLDILLSVEGIEIDVSNSKGKTALMMACEQGDIHSVRKLLKGGANVEMEDLQGRKAIEYIPEDLKGSTLDADIKRALLGTESSHDDVDKTPQSPSASPPRRRRRLDSPTKT